MFQPIYKMFTTFDGLPYKIAEWKSKGLSNEQIKLPVAANHSLSAKLIWINNLRIRVRVKGIQIYNHKSFLCTLQKWLETQPKF